MGDHKKEEAELLDMLRSNIVVTKQPDSSFSVNIGDGLITFIIKPYSHDLDATP